MDGKPGMKTSWGRRSAGGCSTVETAPDGKAQDVDTFLARVLDDGADLVDSGLEVEPARFRLDRTQPNSGRAVDGRRVALSISDAVHLVGEADGGAAARQIRTDV
jgi:hypothetical protein